MKKEELFNIIGEVDEQKVAAAGMAMNKKKSRPVWVKWGAMAACLLLLVGFTFAPLIVFPLRLVDAEYNLFKVKVDISAFKTFKYIVFDG